MRLFSYRHRPPHLGPFPAEALPRQAAPPALEAVASPPGLPYSSPDPESIVHAMARYAAMLDLVRDGPVQPLAAEIPNDPAERARHLKAAALYFDATMAACCALPPAAQREVPLVNPAAAALGVELAASQPRSFAAGLDMILADVAEAARTVHGPVHHHSHALVLLVEHPRDPRPGEPGVEWITGAQAERSALLAALPAVVLASYLRLLGFEARAHTASCSEVVLQRLAVAAGLVAHDLTHPFVGRRYGLAAVTTTLALAADPPLAPGAKADDAGWPWRLGIGGTRRRGEGPPFARRDFRDGAWPFETLPRREQPTTLIDPARVPRFPKRADFFARALFGDLGRDVQEDAKNAHYVMKSPIGACARRALGALLLLQFGQARGPVAASTADPQANADRVKASSYWLGVDAVGLCAVPPWAWYSHDAGGQAIEPYHTQGINLLLDQGHETMEGASGDDWISVAQSMRAYLRFSLLGGVLGEQIRRLGWSARVHSVLDGDLLQPPLLLLSGLGEVSRIGEVILNPFLGPRLKSGTVSTDLPLAHDRPVDFGLQRFCEHCRKCARECPSGAISAGPKVVYHGYEIWKSDAEKCARYRITNAAGGMCGRCMKTCPWNTEGLLADQAWRHIASALPAAAPLLARLDDWRGRGRINPVKTWWWDIELDRGSGRYVRARATHRRELQPGLKVDPASQSLAVYPADVMPPPWPVAHPVDREAGLARYRALPSPAQYRARLARGDTEGLVPAFTMPAGEPPVFPVRLAAREDSDADVARYCFEAVEGGELPPFEAGAHVDVVIAPEYLRPYSLAGDPADRRRWVLAVQREAPAAGGRGGSALMHRSFRPGRRVFVSPPRNHFALDESAREVLLLAGGIGLTPLVAMAHRLHAIGTPFALHVSARQRGQVALAGDLGAAPWAPRVHWHLSGEGRRAELTALLPRWSAGLQLYCCGSARYMDAVFAAARAAGWPDEALHREYFQVPEAPAREDLPFEIVLAGSGRRIAVAAGQRATDALAAAGVAVPTKCSDGLCGVCALPYDADASGEVDHRDHVLGAAARRERVVLCCSRMAQAGARLVLKT